MLERFLRLLSHKWSRCSYYSRFHACCHIPTSKKDILLDSIKRLPFSGGPVNPSHRTPLNLEMQRSQSIIQRSISEASRISSSFASDDTLYDSRGHERQQTHSQDPSQWKEDARTWIPTCHDNRTIVLCFDGTGDEFDSDNSNVVQLVSTLKKDDTSQQLVYYQTGIGTYANPVITAPLLTTVYETLDEMFATNLSTHIRDGYAFLMQNYTYGDKICIFGFSRGAYTARALAGMLQKVGLLPLYNYQQIPFAYDMYKREDPEGLELSETFKRTFCRDVHVDFLGVWDTVASVGLIPRYLPFVSENNGIRHLRHALALDERRIKFLPSYCVDPRKKKQEIMKKNQIEKDEGCSAAKIYEDKVNAESQESDVLEVWFAGVHTDVGGGSVKNDTPHALSRIPLRWMIRECFKCNTGIIFDAIMLQQIGLNITYGPDSVPTLGDIPPRLPPPPPDVSTSENIPVEGPSFVHIAWTSIISVFIRLFSFLRRAHHPASNAKMRRRTIPARAHDASYALRHDVDERYEAEEERKDALSPLYDQLRANWMWTVLEWIPVRVKKQKAIIREIENIQGYTWLWNKGRGRKIYKSEMEEGMKVHRSVKTRLEAGKIFEGSSSYVPQVRPSIPVVGKDGKKTHDPVRLDHTQWNVDAPQHWGWVD